MNVTLDGNVLTQTFPTGGTLHELVDSVRQQCVKGRLIVTVTVDGQPLLDDALTQRLGQPVGDVQQVDLATADPRELCGNVLGEIGGRLEQIGTHLPQIAQVLRSGQLENAAEALRGFLGVWDDCRTAIVQCSGLLQVDLTKFECDGKPVEDAVQALSGTLRELRTAFEARDAVLLADLVQYEAPDLCAQWSGMLKEMSQIVRSGDLAAQAAPK